MSDSKKYYYLKLKENFFDSDTLVLLESMPDGYLYSNVLLKLYLKSLKNEGKLMFNELIPYSPQMIASVTRHQVGTVEKALDIFRQLGLIETLDNGAIFMLDIQNFIGRSSSEGDRKRAYRKRIEDEKKMITGQMSETNVRQMSDEHPPEIEIELEIEKDIEIDIEEDTKEEPKEYTPYKDIVELYHEICISYPKVRSLSENRKKTLKARYKEYGKNIDDFKDLFTKAEESDFLKGQNNRQWKADFDWLINQQNMLKVLEGKYKNKEVSTDNATTNRTSAGSIYAGLEN